MVKRQVLSMQSPLFTRAVLVLLVLLVMSFFVNIGLVLFLIISTGFNAMLQKFQLKRGLPTDFELSTFSTVMVTLSFGPGWGIFVAILSKLFASVYNGDIIMDHFFMILTYINAVLMTIILDSVLSPTTLGFIIFLINGFLMYNISKFILGLGPTQNLSYTGTNLMFNMIVFSIFTNPVLAVLM